MTQGKGVAVHTGTVRVPLGPFTAGKPQALRIWLPQLQLVRITGCTHRPQNRTSQTHSLLKLKPSFSSPPLKSGYYNFIASRKGKCPAIGENYINLGSFHIAQVFTAIMRRRARLHNRREKATDRGTHVTIFRRKARKCQGGEINTTGLGWGRRDGETVVTLSGRLGPMHTSK